jgi:hypothetical protein
MLGVILLLAALSVGAVVLVRMEASLQEWSTRQSAVAVALIVLALILAFVLPS